MKTLFLLFLSASFAFAAKCQDTPAANSKPETQAGAPQKPTRIRVGGAMAKAQLVSRVQPIYPELAKQTKISGTVRLHAIISKDGSVQQLEVISGHPLLVQSALDAVKQWKYRPTLVDGDPVEVDTTIDVPYALNEQKADSTPVAAKPMRIKVGPPIVNNTLIKHSQPVYPQEAKDKKIQGTVIVHVIIGTDGTIKDANAISGDSLLRNRQSTQCDSGLTAPLC